MTAAGLLRVKQHDRVALLTLDDPGRRNSLTLPLVAEIVAAVDELEADDGVGAIVVTGAPPAFCAGADLGDLAGPAGPTLSDEARAASLRRIYDGFLKLATPRCPSWRPSTAPRWAPASTWRSPPTCASPESRPATSPASSSWACTRAAATPGCSSTLVGPQTAAALVLFGEALDGAHARSRSACRGAASPTTSLLDAALAMAARAASAPPARPPPEADPTGPPRHRQPRVGRRGRAGTAGVVGRSAVLRRTPRRRPGPRQQARLRSGVARALRASRAERGEPGSPHPEVGNPRATPGTPATHLGAGRRARRHGAAGRSSPAGGVSYRPTQLDKRSRRRRAHSSAVMA